MKTNLQYYFDITKLFPYFTSTTLITMNNEEKRSLLKPLWDRYWDELFNLSYLLTLDEVRSEGIVVEAFFYLYKQIEKGMTEDRNIKAFLYCYVRNSALQSLKSQIHG